MSVFKTGAWFEKLAALHGVKSDLKFCDLFFDLTATVGLAAVTAFAWNEVRLQPLTYSTDLNLAK
jgi:hypothetical protein